MKLFKQSKRNSLFILTIFLLTCATCFLRYEFQKIIVLQTQTYKEQIRNRQFLLTTIDWGTRRQKLILFIRDKIVERSSLPLDQAYQIAEFNVVESEKYPNVDAMFLTAIQSAESHFNVKAVSHKNAKGIMQIMSSTGRLIADSFGTAFKDEMLFDVETNIKFGAKLVNILYTTYISDKFVLSEEVKVEELILADFNGGPYSSIYFKTKDPRLHEETRKYVPKVFGIYNDYKNEFEEYQIESELLRFVVSGE